MDPAPAATGISAPDMPMRHDDASSTVPEADAASPLEYPSFPRGSTIPDPRSVEEHGRLWQNYRPDKYFLPNDAIEQDRLDFSNAAFRFMLDGALHLAPVQGDPARVLDIGTGTGVWAIQYAREHPGSRVVGSDLSLIQPDVGADMPNVEFVREDSEEPVVSLHACCDKLCV
ncbi:uncharacterized protein PG986_014560 [Apiospora aurea]|uniref:Methyltransferase domain-containing protein n=1 Tax=Apiospora aurea TaxID=335848 RepID=A0ABR1PTM3_9PEZI